MTVRPQDRRRAVAMSPWMRDALAGMDLHLPPGYALTGVCSPQRREWVVRLFGPGWRQEHRAGSVDDARTGAAALRDLAWVDWREHQ